MDIVYGTMRSKANTRPGSSGQIKQGINIPALSSTRIASQIPCLVCNAGIRTGSGFSGPAHMMYTTRSVASQKESLL